MVGVPPFLPLAEKESAELASPQPTVSLKVADGCRDVTEPVNSS
jgi:hypothetical protein